MKLKDHPEKLQPFVFFGVELRVGSKESEGGCPFCLSPGHFFVETQTGKWACHKCNVSGNIPVFLNKLHEHATELCIPEAYNSLAEDRSIEVAELRRWGVTFWEGHPIIPAYNHHKRLANLYKCVRIDDKWKVLSCPTCNLHPFGINLMKGVGPLWVQEGPWDGMAMTGALGRTRLAENRYVETMDPDRSLIGGCDVIALPGCGSFKPEWLRYLKDRDVRLCFDNDHPRKRPDKSVFRPGWDGMQKVITTIHREGTFPESLHLIKWGPDGHTTELPDGHDVRDVIRDKGPSKGLAFIDSLIEAVSLSPPKESYTSGDVSESFAVEPIECSTFRELCEHYARALYFPESLRDSLAFLSAMAISTNMGGDPIFGRLIGPPGSGKSTLAVAFAASTKHVIMPSILTGFHSGYIGQGSDKKKDSSLIPLINHKMVIVKDADSIMSSPSRDRVLSELRDLFDGNSMAAYRNRKVSQYNDIQTTFLLCGTDALRALNKTYLGERFLDCEIFDVEDTRPYLESARRNTMATLGGFFAKGATSKPDNDTIKPETLAVVKAATVGYLQTLFSTAHTKQMPTMPDTTASVIDNMGQLLSYMRAKPQREGHDLSYRPRPELGTRLVSQFTKLGVCLAIVLDKPTIDDEIVKLIRNRFRDTARGFRLEIVQALMKRRKSGMSVFQLHRHMNLPETTIRNIIREMQELDMVTRIERPNNSGIRGRNRHMWQLKDFLVELYEGAL
jgi:predicted transcriptional regulator